MPLAKQEKLTLPAHLSSHPVYSGVCIAKYLVFCVVFCGSLLFRLFSFGHVIVCPSSIYGFWLPLWYLQTFLNCHIALINMWLPKSPLYFSSIFLHSVWTLIASRIESGDTNLVGLTLFNSSCILISGKRTASSIGVGSWPVLCSAHNTIALKMSISGTQNESLHINSFTDAWKDDRLIWFILSY